MATYQPGPCQDDTLYKANTGDSNLQHGAPKINGIHQRYKILDLLLVYLKNVPGRAGRIVTFLG